MYNFGDIKSRHVILVFDELKSSSGNYVRARKSLKWCRIFQNGTFCNKNFTSYCFLPSLTLDQRRTIFRLVSRGVKYFKYLIIQKPFFDQNSIIWSSLSVCQAFCSQNFRQNKAKAQKVVDFAYLINFNLICVVG